MRSPESTESLRWKKHVRHKDFHLSLPSSEHANANTRFLRLQSDVPVQHPCKSSFFEDFQGRESASNNTLAPKYVPVAGSASPAALGRGCVKTFFSAIGAHCWTENRFSTQNPDQLSSR